MERRKDLEIRVTKIIFDMGIPANIKGYYYVRSAIIMAIDRPEVVNFVTKELYPNLAREYETTPSRIERGMRHAITVAWNRGPTQTMIEIFGNPKKCKVSITNSYFIATIAEKIKLDLMQDNN